MAESDEELILCGPPAPSKTQLARQAVGVVGYALILAHGLVGLVAVAVRFWAIWLQLKADVRGLLR